MPREIIKKISMKILFILTDSKYLYGASRSLKGLLDGLNDSFEYDIIFGKSFTQNSNIEDTRIEFGNRMRHIFYMWVPRYRCFEFTKNGFFSELSHCINNTMAWLFRYRIAKLIRQEKYDYIHLNSLVLYPLIEEKNRYIIHNREILKENYWLTWLVRKKLSKAKGIISIDSSTKAAIEELDISIPYHSVITNPIDMRKVGSLNPKECAEELGVAPDHSQTIFAMVGQISEEKGSEFVIKSFHDMPEDDKLLLIIGNINTMFAKKLKREFSSDGRIRFLGEFSDTSVIYRISDCIIRGETGFAVGRTHYEGLFSGLQLLIPGFEENIDSIDCAETKKDKVHFYSPREKVDFCKKVKNINRIEWKDRSFSSNVEEYANNYKRFISNIIL